MPVTQAGQFGNEGRNVVRGPGIEDVDLSLFKYFKVSETRRVQFRAECFNLLNHANLGLPENDLESPAFGQILQAGPSRLMHWLLSFCFRDRMVESGRSTMSNRRTAPGNATGRVPFGGALCAGILIRPKGGSRPGD